MKTAYTSLIFLVLFAVITAFDLRKSWLKADTEAKSYKMGIDVGAGQDGKNATTIQSKRDGIKGYGTLMQNCLPDKFLGKRVRMTGYIKSESVTGWAGLWMRV